MIRPLKETDIGEIWAIEQASFTDPWNFDQILDAMKYPVYKNLVWEEEGKILGYIFGASLMDEAEVYNVAVVPDYRQKGIGEKLMDAFENSAKNEGAKECFLEVRVGNTPARTLYEKRGYEPLGVRKKYYPDGEDALVMKKTL